MRPLVLALLAAPAFASSAAGDALPLRIAPVPLEAYLTSPVETPELTAKATGLRGRVKQVVTTDISSRAPPDAPSPRDVTTTNFDPDGRIVRRETMWGAGRNETEEIEWGPAGVRRIHMVARPPQLEETWTFHYDKSRLVEMRFEASNQDPQTTTVTYDREGRYRKAVTQYVIGLDLLEVSWAYHNNAVDIKELDNRGMETLTIGHFELDSRKRPTTGTIETYKDFDMRHINSMTFEYRYFPDGSRTLHLEGGLEELGRCSIDSRYFPDGLADQAAYARTGPNLSCYLIPFPTGDWTRDGHGNLTAFAVYHDTFRPDHNLEKDFEERQVITYYED